MRRFAAFWETASSPGNHPLRTTIVLSFFLAAVALSPVRLNYTFNVGSESADDIYEDESQEPCSDNIKPTLDNIDQFDWAYCSFDLRAFWTELNIKEETFQQVSSLAEASSIWADIDRDHNPERILRLTLQTAQDAMVRFVILKQTPGSLRTKWRTLAHLDIPRFHLAPEARV